jgi:hypothetical protein
MILLKYIFNNWLYSLLVLYMFISILLFNLLAVDIFIPCIWKKIFKTECYGCGLTRAFVALVNLNFKAAYQSNRLIFIVLPLISYLIINDFYNYLKKHKN